MADMPLIFSARPLEIIDWMGALAQVQDARTHTEIISFLRAGHRPIDVSAELGAEGVSERHVEIMRGELAKIIYEAGRDTSEYLFGNSISSLAQTGHGVDVEFQHGAPRTFDLVVGADGLHSITRRLAFGQEEQFLNFLGGYLAVFTRAQLSRPAAADAGLRRGGQDGRHLSGVGYRRGTRAAAVAYADTA